MTDGGRQLGSAALLAVAVLAGCGPEAARTAPPHIVLISVDALRADHLSCYGYDRRTSPEIDRLAANGTRFSRAFANTHGTPPSHTTMLASLYQETHRVGIDGTGSAQPALAVPAGVTMVQEILSAAGWRTVAVTGGGYLSEEFGFARGFEEFDDGARSAGEGVVRMLERLRDSGDDGRPVFAFLHTYQVHSPYEPPPEFDGLWGEYASSVAPTSEALLEIQGRAGRLLDRDDLEFLEACYDGEIRYTDQELGKLLRELERSGFLDRAVILVTSDHGEEFGEHGGVLHGGKLFEELLRVPLVIAGFGVPSGVVDPALVSLVDVAPTLLSVAGLSVPAAMEGRDLLSQTGGPPWPAQRVFAQYGEQLYAVRTPRWKLIFRPATAASRLFDLRRDPGERRDLSPSHPEVEAGLRSELELWRAERPRLETGFAEQIELPNDKVDELRALGYVH